MLLFVILSRIILALSLFFFLLSKTFGKAYGLDIVNGAFEALHSRCVIVVDQNGTITYTEQVPEIAQEPNYEAALKALKS